MPWFGGRLAGDGAVLQISYRRNKRGRAEEASHAGQH